MEQNRPYACLFLFALAMSTLIACKGGGDTPAPTPTPSPAAPVLTTMTVNPATSTVAAGATQQFTAEGKDQNGKMLSVSPTWTVNGNGALSTSGLFTATTAGTATITASSGGVTGTATVTIPVSPTVKSHTITFNYVNLNLDRINAGTPAKPYNLGTGIRLFADGQVLELSGSAAAGDSTYYISPFTPPTAIAFFKTFTVTAKTLTMEVAYYNVVGTKATPKTMDGLPINLSTSSISLMPVVDGKTITSTDVRLSNQGTNAVPVYNYDNRHNPSRVMTLDLTKL